MPLRQWQLHNVLEVKKRAALRPPARNFNGSDAVQTH